ncbi:APC family permease [Rhodococcus koreensis]
MKESSSDVRASVAPPLVSPPPDSSSPSNVPGLSGRIGVVELMLTVLAFSAPILVVSSFALFVIGYAGAGAPLAFVIAMIFLLLFAVGYTTMTRYIPNPGGFYAYITAGLGRVMGLGSNFLAVFGYLTMAVGTVAFFGIAANQLIANLFYGPSIPWYIYSVACLLATGTLGYFRIDLSAKVLSVVMLCEIGIVLVFDVAVFRDGGPEGRSLLPFAPDTLLSGSVGLAVLFAATCFLGFEATSVFREETKDPQKTVPRATYLSVVLIGLFYIAGCWMLLLAYGPSKAQGVVGNNYAGMFTEAMDHYVGRWALDVVSVLIVTSTFACLLSVQNILSRYCYSLGVDRVLPSVLGRVHPQHRSPYISSVAVTMIMVAILLCFAGSEPEAVYVRLAGIGGFAVIVLMFLTGIAVIAYFRKRSDITDSTPWHTLIAPALSVLSLGTVLYLATSNFTTMTGGSLGAAISLQVVLWAVFAVGMILALVYRRRRPDVYSRIGRQAAERQI